MASFKHGKASGTGYGFNPDGKITREQMAVMLYHYFVKYSSFSLMEKDSDYHTFTDRDRVSSFARPAMEWAVRYGLLNGVGQKRLEPQGQASRAQVAQIFLSFSKLEKYATPNATPEPPDSTPTPSPVPTPVPTLTPAPTPTNPPWYNYNPVYELPTGKSEKDAHGGYFDYDLAREVTRQINELRVREGMKALKFHPQIKLLPDASVLNSTLKEALADWPGWISPRLSTSLRPSKLHASLDAFTPLTVMESFRRVIRE